MSEYKTFFFIFLAVGVLSSSLFLGAGEFLGITGVDTGISPVDRTSINLTSYSNAENITVTDERAYLSDGEQTGEISYDVNQTDSVILEFNNLSWYGSQGNAILVDGNTQDAAGNEIIVRPQTSVNVTNANTVTVQWDTTVFASQAGNTELTSIEFGQPRQNPVGFVINAIWNILTLQAENPIITAIVVYPIVVTIAYILARAISQGLPFT